MIEFLRRRPWLPLAVGFCAFVLLWVAFIWVANRHAPERLEVPAARP